MKRALLIGGSTARLKGIDANLDAMREVLVLHGFEVHDVVREPTRDKMLDALRDLIACTKTADVVVVYFCGHGGLARFDGDIAGLGRSRRDWSYLAPVNDEQHSPANRRFGGILDVELGYLIGRRLAAKADAVTLILECCYAGSLFSREALRQRASGGATVIPRQFQVPGFLAERPLWTHEEPEESGGSGPPRDVVVVAATGAGGESYEHPEYPYNGYFTRALVDQLRIAVCRPTTWGRLIERVQQVVVEARYGLTNQMPHVVGPLGRVVFGSMTHDISRTFPVIVEADGAWQIGAGRLHGFANGDMFEVFDDDGVYAARGIMCEAGPTRARLRVDRPATTPGSMFVAELRERAHGSKAGVLIEGHSPTLDELRASISASAWLRETTSDEGTVARVRCDEGRLVLSTTQIEAEPIPFDARDDLSGDAESPWLAVIDDLEHLARAQAFENYCRTRQPPPPPIDCWMTAGGVRLPASGASIRLDQPVNAGIRHAADYEASKFVNIVDQGIRGRLCVLNPILDNYGGLTLYAGGDDADDHERALSWPEEIRRQPAKEVLWFVITSEPVDLTSLSAHERKRGHLGDPSFADVECFVHRIEFTLQP